MKSLNKIAAITTSLILALSLSSAAQAKTTRTTTVKVENHTGKTVDYVAVVHKYSDNFKENKTWSNIGNGRTTRGTMKIRYNTGFGTSGQDWWHVVYKLKGENFLRYVNPRNGRSVIDSIERFSKRNANWAANELGKVPTKTLKSTIAKKLAQVVIKESAKHLLNNSSTKGFKKHLLRAKDQSAGLTIKLFRNKTVGFYSKTGKSTTGTSVKKLLPR